MGFLPDSERAFSDLARPSSLTTRQESINSLITRAERRGITLKRMKSYHRRGLRFGILTVYTPKMGVMIVCLI